jgi:hypothetical protein
MRCARCERASRPKGLRRYQPQARRDDLSREGLRLVTFFFFGTLMDREVLERVLDRPVAGDELTPGRLAGFRRVRSARAPYPVLVPEPAGVVDGMLLKAASLRDERRITHFEDEEYDSRWLAVQIPDGATVRARVFFALAGMGRTDEPWDFGVWVRAHKEAFLEQCREWMRDCPP